jgi:DNA-binding NtrC family response regulator
MESKSSLETAEREFFQLIVQAAFSNPFRESRHELDAKIVGHSVEPFSEAHLDELKSALRARIQKLDARGLGSLNRHPSRDRDLMQTVFLFQLFHDYYLAFDQLILDQAKAGLQSSRVDFAAEALGRMRQRGITAAAAERFFSIFYQLRRAYHFIARNLIGKSRCMREFKGHLWQNVFTREVSWYERYLWERMEDFSTLLLGETGTGKGAAAAAIGRSAYIPFDEKQGRFAQSFMRGFIALNLSQFSETLIESELFGHRKGSFTGAVEAHEGVLARGSRYGAIFLDEIGEVSVPIQIKLLQVLQERTFCPVGSHEPVRFRGRVIAATNRSLDDLRSSTVFRTDFFYRLCSDLIEVPPLRQRFQEDAGELPLLLNHVLRTMMGEVDRDVLARVETAIRNVTQNGYQWPGNVRELEQAVRRILITGEYRASEPAKATDLMEHLTTGIQAGTLNAESLLASYCKLLHQKSPNYEAVARLTNLDRRTVKKYIDLDGEKNEATARTQERKR